MPSNNIADPISQQVGSGIVSGARHLVNNEHTDRGLYGSGNNTCTEAINNIRINYNQWLHHAKLGKVFTLILDASIMIVLITVDAPMVFCFSSTTRSFAYVNGKQHRP